MPGMNTGLNVNDPRVVAAFRTALLHQGLIALVIFAVLGVAWVSLRAWLPARAGGGPAAPGPAVPAMTEPAATVPAATVPAMTEPAGRRVLRIGFGILWLFDGILQAQPKMAIGLPQQVIEPAAASSPPWVQHLANWAGTAWTYHPVQAGAAAVWIEIGLGIWLLAAPHGTMSRVAGLAGVGWALPVWVFGESFGGILAPGLTWLTGAPGAAGIYAVAGALIALPDRAWRSPRLGRLTLAGLGLFLAGMAVLQAWPGRGFWQGISHRLPGTLAAMAQSMAQTPQPGFLSAWVSAFAAFDETHGFAVNLFTVAALAVTGAAFLSGRPWLIRPVLSAFVVLCLDAWVLIQDLGFLGGFGTDPGSMIPFALLAVSGYLALTRVPACSGERAAGLRQQAAAMSVRSVAALGAAGVIVLGAAPMAVAQASPNADPILAESIDGSSAPVDYPAPGFALTDQYGRTVTLAGMRGKVVLLSFFDPACTAGCPPAGPELRQAALLLGASTHQVELVGIAGPGDRPARAWQALDRRDGLNRVPDWLYLTGTPAQLRRVWHEYGITARKHAAGAAALSYDEAYVIDRTGHVRQEYSTGRGPGTAATRSSFAVLFADAARQALNGRR
jgi:cytochrome oxidase Cu insertion factor (SCO1/SenC/PrrC family)